VNVSSQNFTLSIATKYTDSLRI